MAIFDKFLKSVRLVEDEDYDDELDYEEEEEEEDDSDKKGLFGFRRKKKVEDEVESDDSVRGKLTPMRGGKSSHRMEVCVLRPTKFEDVQEIADILLSNRAVILNMEGLHTDITMRILDFMYGSCYAIDGSVRQISNYIFIISPASVEISGDIQGLVSAFSSTNNISAMSQLRASGGGISSY